MNPRYPIQLLACIGFCFACSASPVLASDQSEFQEVLRLADLDPNGWPEFDFSNFDDSTQTTIRQLLFRLREFSPRQLNEWANSDDSPSGKGALVSVDGTISNVETVAELSGSRSEPTSEVLYRCEYRSEDGGDPGFVMTPRIPSLWENRTLESEPVRFTGIVLESNESDDSAPLVLTNHIGWYPANNVSPGVQLLAKQGMDVSLLDEVRHRQPFVKPNISREGEAFYACLSAISKVPLDELANLTINHIRANADRWVEKLPQLKILLQKLKTQQADDLPAAEQATLQEKLDATRRRAALAAKTQERAEQNLSSVASLFLYPEEETGELVRIEGVARRAVRIAAAQESIGEYYEMEVFPSDSQNLPITCCLTQLPPEFPQGDVIRERVRVDGIFFKSWRFRTRKNSSSGGKTKGQQQLYTPVIVGKAPVWMTTELEHSNNWAIAGGLCFLAMIALYWIYVQRASWEERRRRIASQPQELPGSLDDANKNLDDS